VYLKNPIKTLLFQTQELIFQVSSQHTGNSFEQKRDLAKQNKVEHILNKT
jgi:hypothetical protein